MNAIASTPLGSAGTAGTDAPDQASARARPPAWQAAVRRQAWSIAATLGTVLITLTGLLFVTFVIARLLPVDPVLAIVGDQAPKDVYAKVFLELRLDKPLPEQFVLYAWDMLQGRFGTSVSTGQPVLNDLRSFFPATFELASVAIVIGILVGVPLGAACARFAHRLPDHVGRVVSLFGLSVPIFWLGLVALLIFYARLGWVGGPGRLDVTYQYTVPTVTGMVLVDSLLSGNLAAFGNAISHIALPGTILGLVAVSYIARTTRGFLLWQLSQPYIVVARLKGLSDGAVLWRHALPNAAGPIVAVIALTYANLLEGAVLTETVFAWPGLGLYITQSLFAADLPPVLAGTLVVGVLFMLFNTAAEWLQSVLDPRSRNP